MFTDSKLEQITANENFSMEIRLLAQLILETRFRSGGTLTKDQVQQVADQISREFRKHPQRGK